MQAVTWQGRGSVRVEDVPEPRLLDARDAIVRVTSSAICGSDLHLVDGAVPSMQPGDVLGHEFMGEVVEAGPAAGVRAGDRVVVPFPIACGACLACRDGLTAGCLNSNPNARLAEAAWGHSPAGIFGYSNLLGGYAGGQAEYVRVPYADVGPLRLNGLSDEQALFLGDILPTGYMAAEMCGISEGDVIAVWGCGPVGQFAIRSAHVLGAERVIAIDRVPERLALARAGGAEVLDHSQVDVVEALTELTGGRGPDACIEAVGADAHGTGIDHLLDRALQAAKRQLDRPTALRQAILACRNGGTVSVVGAFGGDIDRFPMGAVMHRGLTIRSGQCHVHRYMRPLMERIEAGQIDPTVVITHRLPLSEAAEGYRLFRDRLDGCVKVVLRPDGPTSV